MELYYNDKDITSMVMLRSCKGKDTVGSRCDSLEIVFENAAGWYKWGPTEDDRILIAHNGYDTGQMYVNTVLPENGRYCLLATALPCKARQKQNRSFAGRTVEEIMQSCAMASGMNYALYGIDGRTVIPYIEQENESAAAFLYRLLTLEGAALKCVNGKYVAIGLAYAQEQAAHQTVTIKADQEGAQYIRSGSKLETLSVRTPYASGSATDEGARKSIQGSRNGDPALNDIQAARWARNLLLDHNRRCETLTLESEFNAGLTAMTRIDSESDTDAAGKWLIEEAEHDFYNKTSRVKMHRCVFTIR